jgi:hypothetical protein
MLAPALAMTVTGPAHVPVMSQGASESIVEDLAVIGTQPCLSCGSRNVHRSKARNLYERFKKLHTSHRLFRCHDCGWRGWLLPLQYSALPGAGPAAEIGDLSTLDGVLDRRAASPVGSAARDTA